MVELVAGCLGAGVLAMFFRALQTRWPSSYYSVTDVVAHRVSTTSARYLLFRLGPVLAVSFLVGAEVRRLHGDAWVAAIILGSIHLATTTARGFGVIARGKPTFARTPQIWMHVAIGIGVLCVLVAGTLLSRAEPLQDFVPQVDELASAMWTAVLAGAVGAYLVAISHREGVDVRQLARRSLERLEPGLWDLAEQQAIQHGADLALVRSIILVENLQRPAWVRRLERLKGKVIPKGTYGVMQLSSDFPITDAESVATAVETRLAGVQIAGGDDEYEDLRRQLALYNPDRTFVDLGVEFYYYLRTAS